jgi:D-serine deaminase-like pyridoxal phosphate-dependent protein
VSLDRRLAILDAVPDTPYLVLDADVTQRNVTEMQAIADAGGKKLRPHAKTHKMLEVARMQLGAGAVGLLVAKLGEAEVMLDSGVGDIFIGYPILGPQKIERLLALAERVRMSVALDDVTIAEPIARAATGRGLVIDVMLEINTGLDRAGVLPKDAVALAQRVADLPGVRVKGVFTHEGQALPRSADEPTLAAETAAACAMMVETGEAIRAAGIPCEEISVGTTPTARFDALAPGVTEIRPGTYVFNDCSMVAHGGATWEDTAVWAVATVVSRPSPDRAIVDAGSKVLSSDRINQKDAPIAMGRIVDRPDHLVVRVMEEHGIVATPPGSDLQLGDRVAIVPSHICTAINLADSVLVARDGAIVDEWRVAARGRVR